MHKQLYFFVLFSSALAQVEQNRQGPPSDFAPNRFPDGPNAAFSGPPMNRNPIENALQGPESATTEQDASSREPQRIIYDPNNIFGKSENGVTDENETTSNSETPTENGEQSQKEESIKNDEKQASATESEKPQETAETAQSDQGFVSAAPLVGSAFGLGMAAASWLL